MKVDSCAKLALLYRRCSKLFEFPSRIDHWAPARNPYWSVLKACFPRKCFLSRSATTCSKIFPILSSMQSGRNEVEFLTGLPGFCNSISRATFHWVENTPLFRTLLKPVSEYSTHWFGIPSGPGAFLVLARTNLFWVKS